MNYIDKVFLNFTYKQFNKNGKDAGMYSNIDTVFEETGVGIFYLLRRFGVFASAIAIIGSFIFMMWYNGRPDKLKESKEHVSRVCMVIILIFAVVGIVSLISSIAIYK